MDTHSSQLLLTLVVPRPLSPVETPSVVSSTPTLSFDIGLFALEEYGIYATSGLPLTYSTNNASVLAVDSATGKLDPKGAGYGDHHNQSGRGQSLLCQGNVTLNVAISQVIVHRRLHSMPSRTRMQP